MKKAHLLCVTIFVLVLSASVIAKSVKVDWAPQTTPKPLPRLTGEGGFGTNGGKVKVDVQIVNKPNTKINAVANVQKTWPGPKPSGSIGVQGTHKVWENGNHRVDLNGGYNRNFGGGQKKEKWEAGINYSYKFGKHKN